MEAQAEPEGLKDTPLNRQKIFVKFCIDLFDSASELSLFECLDPDNANTNKSKHASTFLGNGIGAIVGATVNFAAPGLGTIAGKFTKKASNLAFKKVEQKIAIKGTTTVRQCGPYAHCADRTPHSISFKVPTTTVNTTVRCYDSLFIPLCIFSWVNKNKFIR